MVVAFGIETLNQVNHLSVSKLLRCAAFSLGFLGAVFVSFGIFPERSLTQPEADIALANISRVNFSRIDDEGSLVLPVKIPNSHTWHRIAEEWGQPEFLIAAVSPVSSFDYCRPKLNLTFRATVGGATIPLEAAFAPYSHSTECGKSSLKFSAALGSEVIININRPQAKSLPPGNWSSSPIGRIPKINWSASAWTRAWGHGSTHLLALLGWC